ncbi:MAG: DUF2892 domain-containing protein [Myxococcaceae bacterium]|nr:DUF2892 domain-containing protein [Myxococcaceae bacterium]
MKHLAAFGLLAVVSLSNVAQASELDAPTTLLPSMSLGLETPKLFLGTTEPVPTARTTVFGLPRNVGTLDRIIRGVIAATLIGIGSYRLATDAPMPGWTGALLGIAAIPALTAATGYCPLYHAFGWDTNF